MKKTKNKQTKNVNVLIHNDDQTTGLFVKIVLEKIFNLEETELERVFDEIERNGVSVVASLDPSIAKEKLEQVDAYNNLMNFSLKMSVGKVLPAVEEKIEVGEILEKFSLVMQQKIIFFEKHEAKNFFKSLGVTEQNFSEIDSNLRQGKEVVLRDFDSEKECKLMLELAKAIIQEVLIKNEADSLEPFILSVKSPGDTLSLSKNKVKSFEEGLDEASGNEFTSFLGDLLDTTINKGGGLANLVADGKLSPEDAKEAEAILERLTEKYGSAKGPKSGPKP